MSLPNISISSSCVLVRTTTFRRCQLSNDGLPEGIIYNALLSRNLERTRKRRLNFIENFAEPDKFDPAMGEMFPAFRRQWDEDHGFRWNRPPTADHSVPPTLLHPVFGTFMDDCN